MEPIKLTFGPCAIEIVCLKPEVEKKIKAMLAEAERRRKERLREG